MRQIINVKIITNSQIAKDHFLLRLKAPQLARQIKAGQFVAVKVLENSTDPLLRIPFSIHDYDANQISLLYKVVGKATQILSLRKAEEKINLLGPLGNGFNLELQENILINEIILVAGGYGVAPLYALAKTLHLKNKNITVLLGSRTKEQILCADKFAALGAKVELATQDGSLGFTGLVTDLLEQHLRILANPAQSIVYAAGPNPMLKRLAEIVKKQHIPAEISLEAYMACGIGACAGCAIKTQTGFKLCCKDGPVFAANLID